MKITLIQSELFWEDKPANIAYFTTCINDLKEQTDIIMLPEMFATGFTMNASQMAETMDGEVVTWMKETAVKKNVAICGSLIIEEKKKYYNRFIWTDAEGRLLIYDKRHLFRMGDENNNYNEGGKRIIIDHKGFRILPLVCYDLRFPVWMRRTKSFDYDLILIVANWPERRNLAWKTLLQARAIENQCYVAAVNRVGNDGNGIYHSGDSSVIDPKGNIIFRLADKSFIKTFSFDIHEISEWRKLFPVIEDADNFIFE